MDDNFQLHTNPSEFWGSYRSSYVLNTQLSKEGIDLIQSLHRALQDNFSDAILIPPDNALHITLMDWIAPLVAYSEDKEHLFTSHFPQYDVSLKHTLQNQHPIQVKFNQIKVTPDAIIIIGKDDGSYDRIRSEFLKQQDLIPGTKRPPQIIHSTIARFSNPVEIEKVQEAVQGIQINFVQVIDHFRLTKESRVPMLEFEEIKRYLLIDE